MKIQSISPLKFYNLQQNQPKQQKLNTQNYAYNPIAYNDLTFTARLFRSPEDFYSCSFNKNGMPETMKQYLNADYEDRQHMPPQQMLALVFDDINETKNLEQVKRIFSDEPLFKHLTDNPNKKARTGILAEIDLMKDENKTLFKNGKDNLGHYILKKIYIEGKTLKEINEDFDRDRSVYYNGLSPIEYDTLRAYGIKFPNNAFWKSFTHNRKNFNYTYTPRKSKTNNAGTIQKTTPTPKQHKRFENIKDWELDKLADALNRGNGNTTETRKQLKKSSVRDEAQLNFVAKYMGEINSVVLEKLHVSPEMSEFFENPENFSKSQKQKLEAYWQEPERHELRSIIMKDTIKLFFDAYGVDGQNDEFKELLEYAHSIKPARIAQMKEHERIQAEYDDMFAKLDSNKTHSQEVISEPPSFEELLADAKKNFNVEEYRFETEQGEIAILSNLQEALEENIRQDTCFMPSVISNKFTKFVTTNDKLTDAYILSKLLIDEDINLPDDERLMPQRNVENISNALYQDFTDINPLECRAAQQAVAETLGSLIEKPDPRIMSLGLFEFIPIVRSMTEEGKKLIIQKKSDINKKYSEYKKPLTESDVRKVSMKIYDLLRKYNPKKTVIDEKSPYSGFDASIYSAACYLKNQNPYDFKEDLSKYVRKFGGTARYFIDNQASDDMKMAKLEQFIVNYCVDNPYDFHKYILRDEEGIKYIRYNNPELYMEIFGR